MAKKGRDESKQNGGRRSSGLVITLLGVVFLGFMATQWHDRQLVSNINVVGATGLSRIAVQRAVDTLKSKHLKSLTLADVRTCVESIPYVRSASVYFTGVREMTVEVDERLPVAHVVRPDGSLRYVDAFGVVLPNAVERTAHNVPVLQSTDGSEISSADVQHIVSVLIAGSRTLHPMLYQEISEVRYDRHRHTVEIVTDETSWRLGVMDASRATQAFADMNVFWHETSQRLNMASVSEVDLRWRNQVVLRYHVTPPVVERAA
ncbi:MAG: FtsQ-type POTRA domain-containing protein [Ignavibacteria bacterium]|nr:FtsQ-type POTRA domain-containing protein [Ignavibacteria bacterium]